jgi:hypothetical protein
VFLPSLGEPETPRTLTFDISIRRRGDHRIKALPDSTRAESVKILI